MDELEHVMKDLLRARQENDDTLPRFNNECVFYTLGGNPIRCTLPRCDYTRFGYCRISDLYNLDVRRK